MDCEIYGYHGVLAEEKSLGQVFRFDLRLTMDACAGVEHRPGGRHGRLHRGHRRRHRDRRLPQLQSPRTSGRSDRRRAPRALPRGRRLGEGDETAPTHTLFRRRGGSLPGAEEDRGGSEMDRSDPGSAGIPEPGLEPWGTADGSSRRRCARWATCPHTRVIACSGLYRTAPVGFVRPAGLPESGDRAAHYLGPSRPARRGPRYSSARRVASGACAGARARWTSTSSGTMACASTTSGCTCPIPAWQERRFVLEPLAELAPDLVLAGGDTVAEALKKTADQTVERCDLTEA